MIYWNPNEKEKKTKQRNFIRLLNRPMSTWTSRMFHVPQHPSKWMNYDRETSKLGSLQTENRWCNTFRNRWALAEWATHFSTVRFWKRPIRLENRSFITFQTQSIRTELAIHFRFLNIQFNSIGEMWLKWLFQWEQLLWLLLFFLNETGVGHYWKWMVSRVPKLINEDRISNNIWHFRLANVSRRSEIGGFRPKSNDKTNKSSRRDYVWKTVVWRAAADELDAVPKSSTVGPAHR